MSHEQEDTQRTQSRNSNFDQKEPEANSSGRVCGDRNKGAPDGLKVIDRIIKKGKNFKNKKLEKRRKPAQNEK